MNTGPLLAVPVSLFSRATTAVYKDAGNVRQTAGINTVRSGHFVGGVQAILLEAASTNHFLNSGAPVTQTSPALGIGTYTLWMEGAGSIAVAGTTATITGAGSASAGVPVTFQVTVGGTVTYTVTGGPTLAQAENQPTPTSYIATAGASVTRALDIDQLTFVPVPREMTCYVKFVEGGTIKIGGVARVFQIGAISNAAPSFYVGANGPYQVFHNNGSATVSGNVGVSPVVGDTVELLATLFADGSVQLSQSINGAAATTTVQSAANALAAAWSGSLLNVNGLNATLAGLMSLLALKIATGPQTMATMRSL